jgi:hypothetical protein
MKTMRSVRFLFLALLMLVIPASSFAGVFISVNIAPPVLPVYVQPACPGDGYIWTPGYWAWGPAGYYWVPGTWVLAPEPGFLWTPGYWGWNEGVYVWHAGYWGPHIGFYGGVNYGFGYFGVGFVGGEWREGHFFYNRAVTNVNITNVRVYNNTTVINNVTVNNHVAYNGGPGGISARPTRAEEMAMNERHVQPTGAQMQHERMASTNRDLLASVNHGRPAIAATARPAEFHGRGVVAARAAGGPYRPAKNAAMNHNVPRPQNSARPMERPQPQARNMARPNNVQRPENRVEPAPRPSSYRAENNRPQPRESAPPRPQHESAPRPPREEGGHDHKGR